MCVCQWCGEDIICNLVMFGNDPMHHECREDMLDALELDDLEFANRQLEQENYLSIFENAA